MYNYSVLSSLSYTQRAMLLLINTPAAPSPLQYTHEPPILPRTQITLIGPDRVGGGGRRRDE